MKKLAVLVLLVLAGAEGTPSATLYDQSIAQVLGKLEKLNVRLICAATGSLPALVEEWLAEQVPEVKAVTAHGQMSAGQVEQRMSAFYDRKYDVLLSTSIVESGLDIPSANTLVVYRSDRFGLAQLYQLRGRVGRSKTRAYAYLTMPADRSITEAAQKRLQVLVDLDSLGAGFQLASHDLDIRGAGNLLGDEQSGLRL